ncbi:iron-containing alcohol dehydrogenase [Desulfoscipio gibsoniae]|uniref:Alcohol dehydrogenase, class IV n=1 Tax=Desulfoscipio gibsoniae DSM 7213 TaxID=767817 RepID=R4KAN6_9FIRM|nr:iron-containing alcohol dehydrogenase [Desulfoscipio gibsoniae]AGL00253.1 alcohol dehydrogenase, class IV [Desulfoscipio gibsoniae DSM 7213]
MKAFRVPKDIVFGWGALEYLKQVKGEKAFIVTDKVIESLGFVDKVKGYLEEAGLQTMVFSETEPDPSRDTVEKGTVLMREFKPDWIVGLGGGSSIDAAKGMWVLYEYPDLTWDEVFGIVPPLRNKARFIAIATTSGTGSEVTCASVITNRNVEPHVKNVIASTEISADIAITDPELASQMPPKVTAGTGMDVLTHAIESYTSIAATEIDKAIALRAIQMVFRSLPKAYADGRNQQAREDMHTASLMAGMAFTNSFLGIVHSLAHQLGSQYGIPHGAANSLMLPYVIKFNAIAVAESYVEIADALNIKYEDNRDAVEKLVEAIFQLQKDVGLPQVIKDAGVDENTFFERLDATAQNALNDICTYCNPRVPNVADMKQLYIQAFGK